MTASATVVATYIKAPLVAAGLHAAVANLFDQGTEPVLALDNSYSYRRFRAEIEQASNYESSYRARMQVRVVRNWANADNASVTYEEAVADMMTLGETLEDALTTGPGDAEGCRVLDFEVDNWRNSNEYLQLDLWVELHYRRTRS